MSGDGFTTEQIRNAEFRPDGKTRVFCSYCDRIFIATSPRTLKAPSHRLDLSPGFRACHASLWDKSDPRRDEEYVEINTMCPGTYEPGELVEGEIYESPMDSLKVYRVQ